MLNGHTWADLPRERKMQREASRDPVAREQEMKGVGEMGSSGSVLSVLFENKIINYTVFVEIPAAISHYSNDKDPNS